MAGRTPVRRYRVQVCFAYRDPWITVGQFFNHRRANIYLNKLWRMNRDEDGVCLRVVDEWGTLS